MAVITNAELTTKTVDGTGIFDELMVAIEAHIKQEFDNGAITGSDYATVYLGAMQSVLSEATAFLLSKQRAGLEADLMAQQILVAQQDVINKQKQNDLVDQQILKMQQEVLNMAKQVELTTAQVAIANQEVNKVAAEAGLLNKQIEKVSSETSRIDADKLLIDQNRANALTSATNLVKQQEKLEAETQLLIQKKITEYAQTNNTANGILGAQQKLLEKQRDGFDRDAEQKAAKIAVDTWNLRRSTDTGTVADTTNRLSDAHIGAVMAKLYAGVNA